MLTGVEVAVGSPRCGKRITLSRPIIPVSGAALLLRFVDVAEDFADLDPRPVVFDPPAVVRFWGDDVAPETLSLGPAVTAGIVDEDAAAVVSAVDCAEGRHPAIVAATTIIETFKIGIISCSAGSGWHQQSEARAEPEGTAVPIRQA